MKPNKTATIYDVAEIAGVSITTVSRMLNSPDKVNAETRERILAAIDELNFVPKAQARAISMRGTGRIGVITPYFSTPSFVQRIRGIAAALSRLQYELVIFTIEDLEHFENYLVTLPLTGNLDGLIILSLPVKDDYIKRLTIPTVLIEYPNETLSCVEIDDVTGGRMAAEYLIGKGHSRLAFLGVNDTEAPAYAIQPSSLRLRGFKRGIVNAGLQLPEEYIKTVPYTQEDSRQAARELLSLPEPPTAIFAAADFQAISVLKVARQMKISVPDQLAVIGFDDLDMAELHDLTTIRQHLDESGRLAVEMLLGRIADPNRPVQHIHLPLTIIERETA